MRSMSFHWRCASAAPRIVRVLFPLPPLSRFRFRDSPRLLIVCSARRARRTRGEGWTGRGPGTRGRAGLPPVVRGGGGCVEWELVTGRWLACCLELPRVASNLKVELTEFTKFG